MTEIEPLTYGSDRLIRQWRERYTGRRYVTRQMLDEAEVLVRDAITLELEQTRRQGKTDREYDLERRERQVEHAEALHQSQLDRLRRQLADAEAKIASMSPRMTLMREERETVEQGSVIRLLAPMVPSCGDRQEPRPWMLGEIEDVAYRLRLGGADDSTELRFKRDAIEACVPFAEFALAPVQRPAPVAAEVDRPSARWHTPARVVALAFLFAVIMVAVALGVVA